MGLEVFPDDDVENLDPDLLWKHFKRSTHEEAVRLIGMRMSESPAPLSITGYESGRQKVKEPEPSIKEFLDAVAVVLKEMEPEKAALALEAANFLLYGLLQRAMPHLCHQPLLCDCFLATPPPMV